MGRGDNLMKGNLFALMVHVSPDPCTSLKPLLKRLGVDTFSVRSCEEAAHLLEQTGPHLLFTDTMLPDGSWVDVLNLAEDSPAHPCTILVVQSDDPELRETAHSYGLFDCLEPPFDTESVSQILQSAIRYVQDSKARRARATVA